MGMFPCAMNTRVYTGMACNKICVHALIYPRNVFKLLHLLLCVIGISFVIPYHTSCGRLCIREQKISHQPH